MLYAKYQRKIANLFSEYVCRISSYSGPWCMMRSSCDEIINHCTENKTNIYYFGKLIHPTEIWYDNDKEIKYEQQFFHEIWFNGEKVKKLKKLEPVRGLEPPTNCVRSAALVQLSFTGIILL